MKKDILGGLNEVQREAVITCDGPILVLAGAGSGKTRAITHKIAYLLLEKRYLPMNILAVTFTNKAAGEMKHRVRDLVGPPADGLEMGTFHSMSARFLRRHAPLLGFSSGFTIYDADDSQVLLKRVALDLSLDVKREFPPRKIASILDMLRSKEQSLSSWARDAGTGTESWRSSVRRILETYEQRKKDLDAMDFGDLLEKTRQLFDEFPEVQKQTREQFQYVLVDEMQDTNLVQMRLLQQWVGEHHRICAVGDDDQSIYGWRGARIENMLEFEKSFPGTRVLRMEQNYRSTANILEAANSVIRHNRQRHDKSLWTQAEQGAPLELVQADSEGDEAAQVGVRIQDLCSRESLGFKDVAVFFRTNAQSRSFEEMFTRKRIPYVVVGGTRFYARAEIKDALAYLRTVMNPRDEVSLLRIINTPPRGIGETTVARLRSLAFQRGKSVWETMGELKDDAGAPRWASSVLVFHGLLEGWRAATDKMGIRDLAEKILEESGYLVRLSELDPVESESRNENLNQLLTGIAEYEGRAEEKVGLTHYLEDLALITDVDLWQNEQDRVPLMTVHAAKGLEFHTVFVTGVEEGLFPHMNAQDDRGVEEERRLFYVALTRARKRIVLMHAGTRARAGSWEYSVPSRFLKELGNSLQDRQGAVRRRSFRETAPVVRPPARTPPRPVEDSSTESGHPTSPGHAGRPVVHATLGPGLVLGVIGNGLNAEVMVRFKTGELRVVKAVNLTFRKQDRG